MTMAIFRDDGSEQYDFVLPATATDNPPVTSGSSATVPLIKAKLRKPTLAAGFGREWLIGLLDRSTRSSAATMLIGRAGSGKTALAADFVTRRADHSWYSIDSSDADWNSFQRYFRAALSREAEPRKGRKKAADAEKFSSSPMELFADATAALELRGKKWPSVLVLDGIHHLYDCRWFDEFFTFLIASMPHSSHVLILSRSKPPTPVWRMRSKQVLNVIDEKLLAFSQSEAEELFSRHGLGKDDAIKAHAQTFGRPADMIAVLESTTGAIPAVRQTR